MMEGARPGGSRLVADRTKRQRRDSLPDSIDGRERQVASTPHPRHRLSQEFSFFT